MEVSDRGYDRRVGIVDSAVIVQLNLTLVCLTRNWILHGANGEEVLILQATWVCHFWAGSDNTVVSCVCECHGFGAQSGPVGLVADGDVVVRAAASRRIVSEGHTGNHCHYR